MARVCLLAGLRATTYHTAFDLLQDIEPMVRLCPGERYMDNGKIITSAGVSARIDGSTWRCMGLSSPSTPCGIWNTNTGSQR